LEAPVKKRQKRGGSRKTPRNEVKERNLGTGDQKRYGKEERGVRNNRGTKGKARSH